MGKVRTIKRIAIGTAVAGAAGYVAGVLTASKSGKETRQELKATADKSMADAEKQLKKLHGELGDMVEQAHGRTESLTGQAQKKFTSALDNARSGKDKLQLTIDSLRSGKATDKDLDRALQDAQRAIEHLKDFLKK